jgi:hypothetical protein
MDRRALLRIARTPLEKIERICVGSNAINAEKVIKDRKCIVVLACGHYAYVRAIHRARCPRCQEMFRRSLLDGDEDYISVREGILVDQMEWADDPCRQYNESETRWNTTETKDKESL